MDSWEPEPTDSQILRARTIASTIQARRAVELIERVGAIGKYVSDEELRQVFPTRAGERVLVVVVGVNQPGAAPRVLAALSAYRDRTRLPLLIESMKAAAKAIQDLREQTGYVHELQQVGYAAVAMRTITFGFVECAGQVQLLPFRWGEIVASQPEASSARSARGRAPAWLETIRRGLAALLGVEAPSPTPVSRRPRPAVRTTVRPATSPMRAVHPAAQSGASFRSSFPGGTLGM